MVILILIFVGLALGSFVNALVWRLHEQLGQRARGKGQSKNKKDLSILKGRSMCPNCKHELAAKDLVPVLSWLSLRGKCRYCRKSISWQYPVVELATTALFVASYVWWPMSFNQAGVVNFVVWLICLTGFMALIVYDFRWLILPNRIVYPLTVLALVLGVLNASLYDGNWHYVFNSLVAVAIAGGIFYGLFMVSGGKWIGGGDVKLGFLIGLLIASGSQAFLVLFLASLLGMLAILPGLSTKKLNAHSHVPFGPFLIIAAIIVKLFGASLIAWYKRKFLLY